MAKELSVSTTPCSLTCQPPAPPLINGERASSCRGETTALTATGCPGTVIWSTGSTGATIRVTPHQTTRYTAICRLPDGCVSCFADAYAVTIATPDAPRLTTVSPVICPGDAATLTATNCNGTVRWTDASLTGKTFVVRPQQNTVYRATCEQAGCTSLPAAPLTVRTALPTVPVLTSTADGKLLCAGQTVRLSASGCAGEVRWSDGGVGAERTLTARQTGTLRAVCRVGTCLSDSSAGLTIAVRPATPTYLPQTTVHNTCPYLTADLTTAIGGAFQPSVTYEFRTGPGPDAAHVSTPGAVLVGVYYVLARTREGCLSQPVAVSALITPCANGIAPCLSNPPMVSLLLDSLDRRRGVVCLRASLRGVATERTRLDSAWRCSGTGLFTENQTVRPRYVASEADRQRGTVTFAFATPDPDGDGPCLPGAARLTVAVSEPLAPERTDSINIVTEQLHIADVGTIFIPDGFSPNGDGINDRFVIRGVPAGATVELDVVDRWGHRVFADAAYENDWEGQANRGVQSGAGAGLPDGTYFYVVRVSDGREYVRFLTIAR